jgi:hypothetical protein
VQLQQVDCDRDFIICHQINSTTTIELLILISWSLRATVKKEFSSHSVAAEASYHHVRFFVINGGKSHYAFCVVP